MTRVLAAGVPTLTARMAERWCEISAETLQAKDRFQVALAGGSTPRALYQTLTASPYRERLDWRRHEWFFGDERTVPPDHPDSNWRMAYETLFRNAPIPMSQCHRMAGEAADTEAAAAAYAQCLAERLPKSPPGFPVFDLILLGVGKDGHTASLFPYTAALAERRRSVVSNVVPALGTRRLTITYPVINRARQVWIMATGRDKAEVLAQVMSRDPADSDAVTELPVLGVQPAVLVWWLDAAAAALLPDTLLDNE